MLGKLPPHSCKFCQKLVFSLERYPAYGKHYLIHNDIFKAFLFKLEIDTAAIGARNGCSFMEWLMLLPVEPWSLSQLRVVINEFNDSENLFFQWVEEVDDESVGTHVLKLCAHET